MQIPNRLHAVKFLQDYCYAIYLGVAGLCLASIWGLLIFGAIGFGFDRYYIWWRRERFAEWKQDTNKFRNRIDGVLWLVAVVAAFIIPITYAWLLDSLPDSFFNDFWQPLTEPVINHAARAFFI